LFQRWIVRFYPLQSNHRKTLCTRQEISGKIGKDSRRNHPLSFLPASSFLLAQILSRFDVTLMKLKHFKNTRPAVRRGRKRATGSRSRTGKKNWIDSESRALADALLSLSLSSLSRHFQFSSFISI
jgi:hypothetical protein